MYTSRAGCESDPQINGVLAQLGEHLPYKQEVTGSSPVSSIESLAQLVEHLTFNQRVGSSSLPRLIGPEKTQAGVAELADALDLGSSVFGRVGSSPILRIDKMMRAALDRRFLSL